MPIEQILPLLAPVIVLEVALIVVALRDLLRPERHVRGGAKVAWGIVIVLFGIVGPIVYLLAGREDE